MEYFEYRTKNPMTGKVFRGIITADDSESAADNLKRRGEEILEIKSMNDILNIRKTLYNLSVKTNKKTKAEFFAMLKFMLDSGMSLHESLVSIRDSSINKQLRNMSRVIADEVRKGAALSLAMQRSGQFDNAVVRQVNAGEESGNMSDTLARLTGQTEREIEFSGKIKNAMMYPIMICIVMIVVLWVLMTMVVPSLAETLISMGGELPLITKIVIGVSSFMSKAALYIFIIEIALVAAYRMALRDKGFKLKNDIFILKLPIVGNMLEKIELSRFCRNLSAMQKSGISLVHSLKIVVEAVKNKKIAEAVQKSCRLVEMTGMNLSAALAKSGDFPAMMLQLIEVGIDSGGICNVLDRIAEQYEKDIDTGLKRITSLIEPAMIVVVGLLAGTVVISIFLPMMSIADNI